MRRAATFPILAVALLLRLTVAAQAPSGSIEGVVVRLGGNEVIAGADVELTQSEPPSAASSPAIFRASTTDDGKFVFKNIPGGRYRLVATRAGGTLAPAEYGQRDPKGRGTSFELSAGQSMSGIRLSMAATATITGRVFDGEQDPVPNTRVLALEAAYQNGRRILSTVQAVRTNDLGEYRLFWLRPGRYYVAALRDDFRAYSFSILVNRPDEFGQRQDASSPTVRERTLQDGRAIEETSVLVYYGGGTDAANARAIDLLPGGSAATIDIPIHQGLAQTQRVRGSVTGSDGQAAVGASVRLVPLRYAPHLMIPNGVADRQGRFNIAGAVPGIYWLVASLGASSGYSASESLLDISRGTSSLVRVEVADRDLENVSVVLQSAFGFTGRLRVEGKSDSKWDVTQARISLVRDPDLLGLPNTTGLGARAAVQSNGVPSNDGGFALSGIGQGEYRVTVAGIPSSAYLKSVALGSVDVLRDGLRVQTAPTTPLEIVLNMEGGVLAGSTVNEKSEIAVNATVVLVPELARRGQAHLYKVATSDALGKFEMSGIAPGTYNLFAWESVPAGVWMEPEFIRDFEARSKPVNVTGGSRQDVQISVASQTKEPL